MKKIHLFVLSAILFILLAGCAPGSSVQVNTPSVTLQFGLPGPNPLLDQPDVAGRIARAGTGLWHGLIAPLTLLLSFFSPDIQMYEVHNSGGEYNLGFLIGVAMVFFVIGLVVRLKRS
jgi:hypothetical protein